jgi:hypothetical protein
MNTFAIRAATQELRDASKLSPSELQSHLESLGYKLLQLGGFGSVWKCQDGSVLKLCPRYDSAYIAFVKFCAKRSSKSFPKIYDYTMDASGTLFMVKTEFLYNQHIVKPSIICGIAVFLSRALHSNPSPADHDRVWRPRFKRVGVDIEEALEKERELDPYFKKALLSVVHAPERGSFDLDLPIGNILLSHAGHLVITDPWSITTGNGIDRVWDSKIAQL